MDNALDRLAGGYWSASIDPIAGPPAASPAPTIERVIRSCAKVATAAPSAVMPLNTNTAAERMLRRL